jgi:acylglycerol lipase
MPASPPAPLAPLPRRERWFRSVVPASRLSCGAWPLPAGAPPPRGALLFVHGYAHYCAPLYDWLAASLAPRGLACFALEHVGHGKSDGLRAHVPSFDGLVEDLLRFAAAVRASPAELPAGVPLFAYGESLGAGMCLLAALRAPRTFGGLVLIAPMTGPAEGMVPPWPLVMLGHAAALVAPTAALAPVKEILPLCFRNPAMLPLARSDPNRYSGRMRLRTALELKAAIARLGERGAALDAPVFVAHGTGDAVTSHAASARLLETCASRDKTFVTFEGAWHVLWAEPADTRARLFGELMSWLDAHCGRAAAGGPELAGSAVVFRRVTFPLSAMPFDEGATTAPFSWATHSHLVTQSSPEGEFEHPDEVGAAAAPAAGSSAAVVVAVGAATAAVAALSQGLLVPGVLAVAVAGAAAIGGMAGAGSGTVAGEGAGTGAGAGTGGGVGTGAGSGGGTGAVAVGGIMGVGGDAREGPASR